MNKIYYCIIDKTESWLENFIDEDADEVVSIERTSIIDTFITTITLPNCKNKKYRFDYINSYIRGNSNNHKLNSIVTGAKFIKIINKQIKKYNNIKYIEKFKL